MGVFLHEARREADGLHEFGDLFEHLGRFAHLVHEQGLGEGGEYGHAGVEGCIGILKDHLHVTPDGEHVIG